MWYINAINCLLLFKIQEQMALKKIENWKLNDSAVEPSNPYRNISLEFREKPLVVLLS